MREIRVRSISTGCVGFPLSIRLTQTCVSFEIRPLIDLRIDSPRYQMLSRELLELNTRLQVAKLAVNDVGEVSLGCQVLGTRFLAQPKSMCSIIDATWREQRHGSA